MRWSSSCTPCRKAGLIAVEDRVGCSTYVKAVRWTWTRLVRPPLGRMGDGSEAPANGLGKTIALDLDPNRSQGFS